MNVPNYGYVRQETEQSLRRMQELICLSSLHVLWVLLMTGSLAIGKQAEAPSDSSLTDTTLHLGRHWRVVATALSNLDIEPSPTDIVIHLERQLAKLLQQLY